MIVAGQPNIIKTSEPPKSQPIQKPIVKKPDKVQRSVEAANQPNVPPKRLVKNPVKSSPLKRRKEMEMGRYSKMVDDLRNCGKGRILIMIACGPSIMEVDLPKLKDHPLIDMMSINKPDPRVYPTKYWVFCDQSQYIRNQQMFESYSGTLINAWSVRARHANQVLIRNRSGKGFSKDLHQGYYIGRSTTFANMQTAYWMNYDKVFIFGCDMCKPPNSSDLHFYGRNHDVDPAVRVQRFAKEAEFYSAGASQLTTAECKKFVFCSSYNTWAFTKEFEHMDHKVAVEHIWAMAEEMRQK